MSADHKKYDIVALDDAFVDEIYDCQVDHVMNIPLRLGYTLKGADGKIIKILGNTLLLNPEETKKAIGTLSCTSQMSGGSAANTLVRMQQDGAQTAFTGLIGTGSLAERFEGDLKKAGVDVKPIATTNPNATGRCVVFVTPGQRTMATSLPQNIELDKDKLNIPLLQNTRMFMAQAYLWTEGSKDALKHAFEVVHAAGGKRVFSLSASWRAAQIRDDILPMIKQQKIDVLFGNDDEYAALYPDKTKEQIKETLRKLTEDGKCDTIAYTMGKEGSLLFHKGTEHYIAPTPDVKVVDTTGAGDNYAAGVLKGILDGKSIEASGKQGAQWASEVIQHYGARRPDTPPRPTIDTAHIAHMNTVFSPVSVHGVMHF